MSRRALASIHFEKYSTATAAYLKLPGAVGRGFYNVDAPSCEGPDWGYEVDFFGWEFAIVGVLLVVWAGTHDFMGVSHGRRPIKPFAESFSH